MTYRILFVENAHGFGGSVVALGRQLRALPRGEFEPRVIVRMDSQKQHLRAALGPETRIDVVPMRSSRGPQGDGLIARARGAVEHVRRHFPNGLAIRRAAIEHRADLIHLNNGLAANYGGVIAARRLGLPCVVKQHGFEWPSADVRVLARGIACFLPDSEAVAVDLARLGIPRERMVVTWCPIDVQVHERPEGNPAERAAVRRELGLPADAPVAGMVGMLLRWKGQQVFLDAMAEVVRRLPEARAVIVGGVASDEDPGYPGELRAQAERLGIADRVVFTGLRSDVSRLLPAFDVCVHASTLPEPFGMVIGEAMSARRPVVASAAGGPLEQIEDGVSGFLVPPGDAAAFAARIIEVLSDPELARAIGERARTTVTERFSLERHAAVTNDVYRRLLAGRALRLGGSACR